MTRTKWLGLMVILTAIGCGGAGSGASATGNDCNVTISGAPHSGTFKTCALSGSSGNPYTLSLSELPGCAGCLAGATLPALDGETCSSSSSTLVVVTDPSWDSTGGEAGTVCVPGETSCMPATPCSVNTTSGSIMNVSAGDYTGHWAGSITAHVVGVTGNDVAADVTISGSF